jgi:hypothetical protein
LGFFTLNMGEPLFFASEGYYALRRMILPEVWGVDKRQFSRGQGFLAVGWVAPNGLIHPIDWAEHGD